MIRAMIIDDEPAAIRVLELLLQKITFTDIIVTGTYTNPVEARDMMLQDQPDLVFIDVEMPSLTGIDLVKSIPHPTFRVVFVTAYDAYAVEAFRLSAMDYLLKPVDSQQVEQAVQKVHSDLSRQDPRLSERLQMLEQQLTQRLPEDPKIGLGMAGEIVFIPVVDILYCEAKGAYTNFCLRNGRQHLASKSLGHFENYLQKHGFFRIHHRYLINLDRIKSFQRGNGGYVVMDNDRRLDVAARRYRDFLDVVRDRMV